MKIIIYQKGSIIQAIMLLLLKRSKQLFILTIWRLLTIKA